MSGILVKQAELEDWNGVLNLWRDLKDSPHSLKIEGDEGTLKAFFIGSLTSPHVHCWISIEREIITGFVITQTQFNPVPDRKGSVTMLASYFIRAVYVDNRVASLETTRLLDYEMCNHARANGCISVLGNCRLNFPAKAALKNYGYEPVHLVMRKEL